jgi:hypothetical protein
MRSGDSGYDSGRRSSSGKKVFDVLIAGVVLLLLPPIFSVIGYGERKQPASNIWLQIGCVKCGGGGGGGIEGLEGGR